MANRQEAGEIPTNLEAVGEQCGTPSKTSRSRQFRSSLLESIRPPIEPRFDLSSIRTLSRDKALAVGSEAGANLV